MNYRFSPEAKPLEGYTIKRAIGRGGFGEVYYALSDSGKEVALKLLQHNLDIELRGINHCLNLKHPNLITIFDIRQDTGGERWVVMEFVSGPSLDQVIADHPQGMPVEQILFWLKGACAGVGFLHENGLVHRDIKPGNLFQDQGYVKVGDVGLSKFITPSRRSAQTESVGTVFYMAPEIAHGKYGKEVDIYSLGIILYEMLTGNVPFNGESTGEILMKHLSQSPDLGRVPERYRPVIQRVLEKDPIRRTPTVQELLADFQRAIRGEPNVAQQNPVFQATVISPAVPALNPEPTKLHRWAAYLNANPWMVGALVIVVYSFTGLRFMNWTDWILVGVTYAALKHVVAGYCQVEGVRPIETMPPVVPPPGPKPIPRKGLEPVSTYTKPRPKVQSNAPSPETLRNLTWRERCAGFSRGATGAILGTAIMTLIAFLCKKALYENQDEGPLTIFALVTLLGSWMVLAIGKLTEGKGIDGYSKRLMLFAAGGILGLVAYGTSSSVTDGFRSLEGRASSTTTIGNLKLSDNQGIPTALGFALFFAQLFAFRRWWYHVDSYRPGRLRLITLAATVGTGFLISSVYYFPHNWAVAWATSICLTSQLAAPWSHPDRRIKA